MEALRDYERNSYVEKDNISSFSDKKEELVIRERREIVRKEKIKKHKEKQAKKRFIFLSSSIIFSAVLIILLVVGYTDMVKINSDLIILEAANKDLAQEKNSLEFKLEPYLNKSRIENLAKEKLHMIYPTNDHIVKLKEDSDSSNLMVKDSVNKDKNKDSIMNLISKFFN